ncbi:MAG: Ribonuclease P protein component [candidate division TA06 bacterium ADurb.Bin131]|jgi:ribonuclease P protein component|uniref:Ribonuclease P protein component n=1 Tax=candidate division TA06 bacterium ADurb.Bin131 TaxID=1852827 RepID=A0A1V6C465_UNCT6|nr:MAG: Ribonuclease P protein component [candidate division TA06 bacterium ADurb.Bin131]HON06362.1 ribonuclease P protein component [bacterium]HQL65079.1 ribonuclease P protein component [bacterium]HRV04790.1 ribonuclease P protein component [Candidatus Ratteibacteria bacterium]
MRKRIIDLIKRGNKITGQYFDLYYKKADEKTLKIGFQVSRRCGNSVVRNKVKRRIRLFIRKHLKSGDFFIKIKVNLKKLTDEDIEREWNEIKKRIFL